MMVAGEFCFTMRQSAESLAIEARSGDGEEGKTNPAVDEGGGAHAQGARAREDEDDGDRRQGQTERGCRVSAGIKAGGGAGRRSKETGVKETC